MKHIVIYVLVFSMLISPLNGVLYSMPVPSAPRTVQPQTEERAGGYYSYYYDHDPFFLFFESLLYIGLVVGALILLDQQLDNVTIIIYD